MPLDEAPRPYIDWSPFFLTWELKGKYPRIFDDPNVGEAARKLFDDANALLDRIIDEKLLTARGVYGFWPAASDGDDIVVYADESRSKETVPLPRAAAAMGAQRAGDVLLAGRLHRPGRLAAAQDYLGAFAVTAGIGCDELAAKFDGDHDDYNSIMTKALADRLAEAFAEYLHAQARRDWGFGATRSSRTKT